jgi:two-component system chemotaxis response regulator CheB
MAYRILIVDDSTFFRRRIKQILEQDPELKVVGEAKDGAQAIASVKALKPDVITMDVEMPVMDGITAVKKIMADGTVPIIMFSSLTHDGAQATLDALDAGAMDFLPKKFEDIALNRKEAVLLLQNRVKTLARSGNKSSILTARIAPRPVGSANTTSSASRQMRTDSSRLSSGGFLSKTNRGVNCLAIGASTGGPVALQKILTEFPSSLPVPVIMVQHMPGTFTRAFAKRLDDSCKVKVKEAENGEMLKKGVCYLAPGGKQMTISGSYSSPKITISEPEKYPNAAYKPCVDITFSPYPRFTAVMFLGSF